MTWLELTIIYLAIGCAVGMWLTFKDLEPHERIPSKVIKRFLFWPAYFLSLSKRKSKTSKRLNFVFDGDRFPDALAKAESLLSKFQANSGSTEFFEFKDDLERYIGLRFNLSETGGNYDEFLRIAGIAPTESQKRVIIRNQQNRVTEHFKRARTGIIETIVRLNADEGLLTAAKGLFESIEDRDAIETLENVKIATDKNESVAKEGIQWIQKEKILP